MFRVAACVFGQHNLALVALAALLCVGACAGVFFVLDSARAAPPRQQRVSRMLAAVLAGGGGWATHFLAMLAYEMSLPMGFKLGWTLASAASGVVLAYVAFEILHRRADLIGRLVAGAVLGSSIVALHFIGMIGLSANMTETWSLDLVVASIVLSLGFGAASLAVAGAANIRRRNVFAAGLFVANIVALHFTAMASLTLTPDPTIVDAGAVLDRGSLATVIAIGAAAMLIAAVAAAFADRRVVAVELAAAEQAKAMALHDALTGLPNRRQLNTRLAAALQRATPAQPLALVMVDLDRFKPVNDLYGHGVGDEVLVRVARLLEEEANHRGFAARLGGDEFCLVLEGVDAEDLLHRLTVLVTRFEAPMSIGENDVSIGATLGVAMAPADGDTGEELMRRADAALYRAKAEGRGRFSFFEDGMDARVLERAALERDLRVAVRVGHVEPFFQPLVHLADARVTGYEVLARWRHPMRGLLGPDQFISIAEETGLIGELSLTLLRKACLTALDWPGAPRLSFNISPVQLRDSNLPQKILAVLEETGFPTHRLIAEITENGLVADFQQARAILIALKDCGVCVALDDFGTGYSSLRHLRELPFDVLKIDRSFVHSMTDSAEAMSIIRTIVQMAQNLGLGVTAEGVETASQARILQEIGCDAGQGFLYGRPAEGAAEEGEQAAKQSAA